MRNNVERTSGWDPDLYLTYKNERTQPSIDLVSRITLSSAPRSIIDIGCGPGNSSQVLMQRWPQAQLFGIDSSPAMIERAKRDYPSHTWIVADASGYRSDTKFDIVFSNAALQWIPNHIRLLDVLCNLLSANGVLAVQIPQFREMPLSKAIEKAAENEQWQKKMDGCSSALTYHDYRFYYDHLADRFRSFEIWETYYLHPLASHTAILAWIKSTGLKPYLDCLQDNAETEQFEDEVLQEIKKVYPLQKNGMVILPFKRLFFIGYTHKPASP